jgi:type IV pilus assembly protein PilE
MKRLLSIQLVSGMPRARAYSARARRSAAGLTLIELMIVVVVVAVLSAVALPSYRDYLKRGYRAEARAALMQAAHWMERAATATGSYHPLPATLQSVPSGTYTITASAAACPGMTPAIPDGGASTFCLVATPQNAQTGDICGSYTLDNTGHRSLATATATVDECWGR